MCVVHVYYCNLYFISFCHISGIEDTIDYTPGSNQKSIGENAALHMCDQCKETKVTARVRLTTHHIGKGCDRDTYSIQSQRKLCGESRVDSDCCRGGTYSIQVKEIYVVRQGCILIIVRDTETMQCQRNLCGELGVDSDECSRGYIRDENFPLFSGFPLFTWSIWSFL